MMSEGGADTLQGGEGRDEFTVSEQTAAVEGGDSDVIGVCAEDRFPFTVEICSRLPRLSCGEIA